MTALYRIVPCPGCAKKWWKRGCSECRGKERVAVALTPRELEALCFTTFTGDLYRSRESAEAVIGRKRP